jgi:hypothetical protein
VIQSHRKGLDHLERHEAERMEKITKPAMTPTLAQVADGTDDQENSMPNIFRGDDDEDDDDAEEDAKILNMSLIKSILGNSSYGSPLDLGNSNQANISDGERAEKPHESRKVSFRDVGSVASSHEDEEKSHDELVKKIGELQAKLTQAEIDKSAEKAMRRKKDKSLVKLAKELNKRAADQQAKEKQVNLVGGSSMLELCFMPQGVLSTSRRLTSHFNFVTTAQGCGCRFGSQTRGHAV